MSDENEQQRRGGLLEAHRLLALRADLNAEAAMWKGTESDDVKVAIGKLQELIEQAWNWSTEDFQRVTIRVLLTGPTLGALEVEMIGTDRLNLPPR